MATSNTPRASASATSSAKTVGAHTINREAASAAELGSTFSMSKRELIALVVGMLASAGTTYFGSALFATLSLAALAFTGSVFLAFIIYFIGVVIAMVSGIIIGSRIQRVIVDGTIDRKVSELTSSVSGAFGSLRTRLFA